MRAALLLVIISLCGIHRLSAQDFTIDTGARKTGPYISNYTAAIGVKMYPSAITHKKFYRSNKAIETLGYFTLDGFRATILNEMYSPIEGNDQLSWYVGYGGHVGIWSEAWKKNNPNHTAGIAVGVDGILGLDYKLKNAPLNISVDWQPSFNFVGASYFESGWAGIGIRYVIK
jgi:hypothetical protein